MKPINLFGRKTKPQPAFIRHAAKVPETKTMGRVLWDDILNFFFPRLCTVCSSYLTAGEEHICIGCLNRLPRAAHFGRNDNRAAMRMADFGTAIPAASLLNYSHEKSVQDIIYSFKYYGNKELAFIMGRLMGQAAQPWPEYSDIDYLVPVPLHRRKERRRGYNQAEWLCRGISSVWETPVVVNALLRCKPTKSQVSKSYLNRKKILSGNVFAVTGAETLEGKNLLLVDDVLTTGSTITACATPLLKIAGTRVMVFTLAVT
ncbi:MAG: ComF family protein [Tannerellaceae bacterium]|jgi:ComF family protein|nr:ComF family protein [Tannerellaceae bacterium]